MKWLVGWLSVSITMVVVWATIQRRYGHRRDPVIEQLDRETEAEYWLEYVRKRRLSLEGDDNGTTRSRPSKDA